MLYEVTIILQGKKAKNKDDIDGDDQLIVEPKWVLAKSDKVASMKTLREAKLPDDIDYERVQVLVRPFA